MTDPATLAMSLGKPVARGFLSVGEARAAIAVTTIRALADGTLQGKGTFEERLPLYDHMLALSIRHHESQREQAIGGIAWNLKPMINAGVPSNKLLAEAFNVNADSGSPLLDEEVREVTATEVSRSLQRKPNVPRR